LPIFSVHPSIDKGSHRPSRSRVLQVGHGTELSDDLLKDAVIPFESNSRENDMIANFEAILGHPASIQNNRISYVRILPKTIWPSSRNQVEPQSYCGVKQLLSLRHREGSLLSFDIKVAFAGKVLSNELIIALNLRLLQDVDKLLCRREGAENFHKPVPTPLIGRHVERRRSNPICSD